MYKLNGEWQVKLSDGTEYKAIFPGTLDTNKIGYKDYVKNPIHPDEVLGNDSSQEMGKNEHYPIIETRFTRKYSYEGKAFFNKEFIFDFSNNKRYFLEIERARKLNLYINGESVPHYKPENLITPHIFELTDIVKCDSYQSPDSKCDEIVSDNSKKWLIDIVSDNSYEGMPHDDICNSSGATDETQTNWNGLLGNLLITEKLPCFISDVRILPYIKNEKSNRDSVGTDNSPTEKYYVDLIIEIDSDSDTDIELEIKSDIFEGNEKYAIKEKVEKGIKVFNFCSIPIIDNVKKWDIYEGNLQKIEINLKNTSISSEENKAITFGIRHFSDDGFGHLSINGRRFFLRGETNCAEYPENGFEPMTIAEWEAILSQYKAYGINCVRFHSHCPSEAAFVAADNIGMLLQPELNHWNPKDAFISDLSFEYYKTELEELIKYYSNHPSFVMLTLGNELITDDFGHRRMDELLNIAHKLDCTRLYANGSNVHYGMVGCDQKSDYYPSQSWYEHSLRATSAGNIDTDHPEDCPEAMLSTPLKLNGYLNNQYPNAKANYDETIKLIRTEYNKPVFGFETGQYEILPDFHELSMFNGISEPDNIKIVYEKAKNQNMLADWDKYVEATGELALICYREEMEAALRTEDFSGTFFLSLQDFPGQGVALVGMMNSHMLPKPYDFAKPERFEDFCQDVLPLVLLERYTYVYGEEIIAEVKVANYGKENIKGNVCYELIDKTNKGINNEKNENAIVYKGIVKESITIKSGQLSSIGDIIYKIENPDNSTNEMSSAVINDKANLIAAQKNRVYNLRVWIEQGKDRNNKKLIENSYPIWIYNDEKPLCPDDVYETEYLDDKAKQILNNGGKVFLSPKATKDTLPFASIGTQFSTDFWSVNTFKRQEGGMGQLIDSDHPIFDNFPTNFYSNWQWWIMANTRAIILPRAIKAIITELDSIAYMRPMAKLFEGRCMGGKLMFSSMGLKDICEYPEAKALLSSIYKYMESDMFNPIEDISDFF